MDATIRKNLWTICNNLNSISEDVGLVSSSTVKAMIHEEINNIKNQLK